LTKIASSSPGTGVNKKILVTYPEALFEKVVIPSAISSNIIFIKAGDQLDVERLLLQLADYGFERTDFVYEPGQFAIRGGILDIYSFGNEKPYRIELFGNDVDSIRIVDPETQLSERRLLQVSIIPNVDTQFESEERVSLFEFLPSNTVVWMQDYDLCRERLADCEEDLHLFLKISEDGLRTTEAAEDKYLRKEVSAKEFISPADFGQQILDRHLVEFGHRPSAVHHPFEIEFHTKEQPAFNRQFDLLIRDLKNWESKRFQLFIFAENPKQLERLHSIFTDLKAEIVFNPVATSIHEGFIDEDLKIV
jgi:transcription-repair coupling factor (superfamily II helicase)